MSRDYEINGKVYLAVKIEAGRYDILLQGTGRVGEVTGSSGNWAAYCHSKRLTSYNRVGDAIKGIDNDLRNRAR